MAFCCFSQASFFASQATKPRTVWNYASPRPVMRYNSIVRKEQVFLLGFANAKAVLPKTRVCDRSSLRSRPVTTASLAGSSQIASSVFTVGTVLVLPFYALMVFVPHSELAPKTWIRQKCFVSCSVLRKGLEMFPKCFVHESTENIFSGVKSIKEGSLFSEILPSLAQQLQMSSVDFYMLSSCLFTCLEIVSMFSISC